MTLETLPADLELPVLQPRVVRKPHGFSSENQPFGKRGRKKGSISKITSDIKQGVLRGAHNCGYDGQGLGGVDGFLLACAQRYPKSYLQLLGRMLPMTMTPEASGPTITAVNILSVPSGCHLTPEQMECVRQGQPFTIDHEPTPDEPALVNEAPPKEPIAPESETMTPAEMQLLTELSTSIGALARQVGVSLDE